MGVGRKYGVAQILFFLSCKDDELEEVGVTNRIIDLRHAPLPAEELERKLGMEAQPS